MKRVRGVLLVGVVLMAVAGGGGLAADASAVDLKAAAVAPHAVVIHHARGHGISAAKVRRYWTKARMRQAIPLDRIQKHSIGTDPRVAEQVIGTPSFVPASTPKRRRAAALRQGLVSATSASASSFTRYEDPNTTAFPEKTNGKVFFTDG